MSGTLQELLVGAEQAGQRLDLFIGHALGLSRTKLKRLFDEGAIRVDGRAAKKGDLIRAGQKIAVTVETEDPRPLPEPELPLQVLHEDAALLFLDKPAKVPVHPLRAGERGTVANALVARYPECLEASADPREGGLCHRLDVETSGVLLAARTRAAWDSMRAAFAAREAVDKRYWALVAGPIGDEGEIDLPLKHDPRHADRVLPAADGADGAREALTHFRVLARAGEYSLVEARIFTGVLHQVRAHLAAIGAPLVGDERYGGPKVEGLDRFFLHARSLEVTHPDSGERLCVRSELPPDLRRTAEGLGISLATG